jgi:hypothetical protein
MHFRPISLRCDCGGRFAARIRQVGLSRHRELVVHWWCPGCKRTHYTVKALADCWRECGQVGEEPDPAELDPHQIREPDAQFLHSLGVSLPDDDQD